MKRSVAILTILTLTGCSAVKPPSDRPMGLTPILMDYRMVRLAGELEGQQSEDLEGWLRESLIPYVSYLEAR